MYTDQVINQVIIFDDFNDFEYLVFVHLYRFKFHYVYAFGCSLCISHGIYNYFYDFICKFESLRYIHISTISYVNLEVWDYIVLQFHIKINVFKEAFLTLYIKWNRYHIKIYGI